MRLYGLKKHRNTPTTPRQSHFLLVLRQEQLFFPSSVPVAAGVGPLARRGAGPLYSSSDANSKENRFANVNSFVLVYEQI